MPTYLSAALPRRFYFEADKLSRLCATSKSDDILFPVAFSRIFLWRIIRPSAANRANLYHYILIYAAQAQEKI